MPSHTTCVKCGVPLPDSISRTGRDPVCHSCFEARSRLDPPITAFPAESVPPPIPTGAHAPQGAQHRRILNYVARMVAAGRQSSFVSDLRTIDFKAEILPFSEHSLGLIRKDFVFWSVTLLAIVPLFLVTLNDTDSQLTGFCLFFAGVWGLVFKKFVVEDARGWRAPLGAMAFTAVIGLPMLLQLYRILPDFYLNLSDHRSALKSLLGYIFQVGLFEELCKIVPALLYLAIKRRDAQPLTLITVGVFSGLGFAAVENLAYTERQILRSAVLTHQGGLSGLKEGVQGAMVNVMLRSMSTVFGHAVYSGIFSYFLALGWLTQRRRLALGLIGLAVAATVHALYDWFWRIQITLPALVTAAGFMLFYAYVTKLRLLMVSTVDESAAQTAPPATGLSGAA